MRALTGANSRRSCVRLLRLQVLGAFNSGDLDAYERLCAKYAAQLNGQPALVAEERKLREKITILALMEIIARLPHDEHVVQMKSIAERTKLSADGAEFLVMKALSVHLIEGSIDQVDGTVRISWVQPRVLLLPQVRAQGRFHFPLRFLSCLCAGR